jgi:hypothetical protein
MAKTTRAKKVTATPVAALNTPTRTIRPITINPVIFQKLLPVPLW